MQKTEKQQEKGKKLQELSLSDDFLFFKVMEDDELCKGLLELIFGKKIRKFKRRNQHFMKIGYDSRGIQTDVYLEGDGTLYVTEMQKGKLKNLPQRSRYYQSVVDVENLHPGEDVKQLKKSYIIFLCTFPLFDGKYHLYSFRNRCNENHKLALEDGAEKIFISSKGTADDISFELKEYLSFIEVSDTENFDAKTEYVKKLQKKIYEIKHNQGMEVEYMTLEMKLLDIRNEAWEEGIEKGRIRGESISFISLIRKKFERGMDSSDIAEQLELEEAYVNRVIELLEKEQKMTNEEIADMIIAQ